MSIALALDLLNRLQHRFCVHLSEEQRTDYYAGLRVWRLTASHSDGRRWAAQDPDYYRAARLLAELMGAPELDEPL